jgi:hypothetical protein
MPRRLFGLQPALSLLQSGLPANAKLRKMPALNGKRAENSA